MAILALFGEFRSKRTKSLTAWGRWTLILLIASAVGGAITVIIEERKAARSAKEDIIRQTQMLEALQKSVDGVERLLNPLGVAPSAVLSMEVKCEEERFQPFCLDVFAAAKKMPASPNTDDPDFRVSDTADVNISYSQVSPLMLRTGSGLWKTWPSHAGPPVFETQLSFFMDAAGLKSREDGRKIVADRELTYRAGYDEKYVNAVVDSSSRKILLTIVFGPAVGSTEGGMIASVSDLQRANFIFYDMHQDITLFKVTKWSFFGERNVPAEFKPGELRAIKYVQPGGQSFPAYVYASAAL